MKHLFALIIPLIILVAHFPANASSFDSVASVSRDPVPIISKKQRQLNLAMAPVKSKRSLEYFMLSVSNSTSPLNSLSKQGRAQFLESLTFNEKGLTSFDAEILEEELTPTQIYRLLSLFGAQHTTRMLKNAKAPTAKDRELLDGKSYSTFEFDDTWDGGVEDQDYKGYRCDFVECVRALRKICLSGC